MNKIKITLLIFFFHLLLFSQEAQNSTFIINVIKKKNEYKNEISFSKAQSFYQKKE